MIYNLLTGPSVFVLWLTRPSTFELFSSGTVDAAGATASCDDFRLSRSCESRPSTGKLTRFLSEPVGGCTAGVDPAGPETGGECGPAAIWLPLEAPAEAAAPLWLVTFGTEVGRGGAAAAVGGSMSRLGTGGGETGEGAGGRSLVDGGDNDADPFCTSGIDPPDPDPPDPDPDTGGTGTEARDRWRSPWAFFDLGGGCSGLGGAADPVEARLLGLFLVAAICNRFCVLYAT